MARNTKMQTTAPHVAGSRSVAVSIEAPPSRVWPMIADLTRMGEWSPETVEVTWLDGATQPAVGARFKGRNKRRGSWSTTCTVTELEPGRTLAFSVGKGETTWRFDVDADGERGTTLRETFEIVTEPGAVGRWMTKLGVGVAWADRADDLEAGARTTLENIKTAAEGAS